MDMMNIAFPILLVVVFYFFLLRPQLKEKKETEKMLAALKKGDRVLTTSGIYAEVFALKDADRVTLKLGDEAKVDFTRSSVARVLEKTKD